MTALNFDYFSELAKTDPATFEAARKELIQNHILSLPEHLRKSASDFQLDLDLKRMSLSPDDFLTYCTVQIQNNINKLTQLSESLTTATAELSDLIRNEMRKFP